MHVRDIDHTPSEDVAAFFPVTSFRTNHISQRDIVEMDLFVLGAWIESLARPAIQEQRRIAEEFLMQHCV